jgi:hypothetical protein
MAVGIDQIKRAKGLRKRNRRISGQLWLGSLSRRYLDLLCQRTETPPLRDVGNLADGGGSMRVKTMLVFLCAAAVAASAVAQMKTSGTAQCKAEPPAPVAIGDKPGHSFAVGKAECTWSNFEIAGVPYKDGVSVSMDEITGEKSTSTGYHTATLANGDKTTARFHGTTTMKDGKFVSGGGTWTFVSGTGKCKGIKGQGTYEGTPNADGTVSYKVVGEYSLPK